MSSVTFSQAELIRIAKFSPVDMARIQECRHAHTRLGFAYQLAFVRLANRLPAQEPLELMDEILTYVGVQIDIPPTTIHLYTQQRRTIVNHQQEICDYLQRRRFGEAEVAMLEAFLFEEACRLEQTGPLLVRAKSFLQENSILFPADGTLHRLIASQRQQAREHIFQRVMVELTPELTEQLDALLIAGAKRLTPFQALKQPPGRPSPTSLLRLTDKLEQIQGTGTLSFDLSWLNNNYQRMLARYAQRCSADRLRDLQAERRYGVLICFLWQVYRDTIDYLVDMHDKIMTSVHNRAQEDIDEELRKRRHLIRSALTTYKTVGNTVLDRSVEDQDLRRALFSQVDQERLAQQMEAIDRLLTGKHSHVLNLIVDRFSYLRQFAPALLAHLEFHLEEGAQSTVVEAARLLREMNRENRRKLPEDVPTAFIPEKLRSLVEQDGVVDKHAWECVLLTSLRDEIRAGNVFVEQSKRFGRFDDFFIPGVRWASMRESFFARAGLPVKAEDVPAYLTGRLTQAYEQFLTLLPENSYASIHENRWQLSVDPAEKLDEEAKQRLETLKAWIAEHLREIKLPELLIEVDNELHFTRHFMLPAQPELRAAEQVCTILATIIAHGCNIGPYTMARLTEGITYRQIKQVTDWQLSEEAQRQALAQLVNSISRLDVTQAWGVGRSSSSDGQRFRFRRQVLQRTYSHRLNDYALEFYSFVADNYAPLYSTVIECTDRDAAYVLDGLLYNESDLALEEHYTDTHGYTEINFAAFVMLGRRFAPRIRGLHKQRIYRIDTAMDYV